MQKVNIVRSRFVDAAIQRRIPPSFCSVLLPHLVCCSPGSTVSLAFSRRLGRRTSGGGGGHMAGLVGLPGYIDSSRSTVSYSVVLTRGFPSADDLIDVGHHHDGCSGCREADSTGQGTSRVREIVRIGGVEVVLNEDINCKY